MTKLLQDVIERVRQWPDARQDEAARLLLEFEAQQTSRYRLMPEQLNEMRHIHQKVRDVTATFASDEEMAAFWKSAVYEAALYDQSASPSRTHLRLPR